MDIKKDQKKFIYLGSMGLGCLLVGLLLWGYSRSRTQRVELGQSSASSIPIQSEKSRAEENYAQGWLDAYVLSEEYPEISQRIVLPGYLSGLQEGFSDVRHFSGRNIALTEKEAKHETDPRPMVCASALKEEFSRLVSQEGAQHPHANIVFWISDVGQGSFSEETNHVMVLADIEASRYEGEGTWQPFSEGVNRPPCFLTSQVYAMLYGTPVRVGAKLCCASLKRRSALDPASPFEVDLVKREYSLKSFLYERDMRPIQADHVSEGLTAKENESAEPVAGSALPLRLSSEQDAAPHEPDLGPRDRSSNETKEPQFLVDPIYMSPTDPEVPEPMERTLVSNSSEEERGRLENETLDLFEEPASLEYCADGTTEREAEVALEAIENQMPQDEEMEVEIDDADDFEDVELEDNDLESDYPPSGMPK